MLAGNRYELHEAIQIVLSDQPNLTATIDVIRTEIGRRKLYRKADGGLPSADQIQARFYRHRELFQRVAPATFRLIGPKMMDDR